MEFDTIHQYKYNYQLTNRNRKDRIRCAVILDNFTYKYIYYTWLAMVVFISLSFEEITNSSIVFIILMLFRVLIAQLNHEGEAFYKDYVDRIQQIIDNKWMPLPQVDDMSKFRLNLTCGRMLREHITYRAMIPYSCALPVIDVTTLFLIIMFGSENVREYNLETIQQFILFSLLAMDSFSLSIKLYDMLNKAEVKHFGSTIKAREFYYMAKFCIIHAHEKYRMDSLLYET